MMITLLTAWAVALAVPAALLAAVVAVQAAARRLRRPPSAGSEPRGAEPAAVAAGASSTR